jgi:hypothetical protein
MFKKIFYHSILAGVLASIAGIIYYRIYFFATEADFSIVLNTGTIVGLNIMACILAGIIYWALAKSLNKKGEIVFNFLFSIISFACVMVPISLTLPLKIQFPELFPGLAVPMVFFPALAWFTVKPLFNLQEKLSQ